jgi:hypothetical protein
MAEAQDEDSTGRVDAREAPGIRQGCDKGDREKGRECRVQKAQKKSVGKQMP